MADKAPNSQQESTSTEKDDSQILSRVYHPNVDTSKMCTEKPKPITTYHPNIDKTATVDKTKQDEKKK